MPRRSVVTLWLARAMASPDFTWFDLFNGLAQASRL